MTLHGDTDAEVAPAVQRAFAQREANNELPEDFMDDFGKSAQRLIVDLLPEDALLIRQQGWRMMTAIMRYESRMSVLGKEVLDAILNGRSVNQAIWNPQPKRKHAIVDLAASVMMDFRVALLLSEDLRGEDLVRWLPEYEGRWRYEERQADDDKGGLEAAAAADLPA